MNLFAMKWFPDLSVRKRAEEALRLARQQFRRFIDSNIVGIVIADTAGAIIEANDYYLNLIGFTRQELEQGKVNWRAITPPEWSPADQQAIRELRERGTCTPYEKEHLRRDGNRVPVFLAGAMLPGPGEQIAVFALDISERKRAEHALRNANAYNRSLIEASLDPLVTIRPDGKITDVNAATEAATGFSRKQLIGTDFSDYFTEPAAARLGYQQVFREGSVRDYPLGLRHRDGRITSVLFNASVYRDGTGQGVGVFFARDISARMAAEAALKQSLGELGRSNKDLEHFAYVASHDLQEPLRGIGNFSELLAKRYAGKLDADADDFIGFIVDGANRMQKLIDDLLTYSRVGTRVTPFGPVACEQVLESARSNLEAAIAESGAMIAHDPLPTVQGDMVQLVQLFQNLLGNAVKFRHDGGPPRVHISAALQNGEWTLSFRDNGIGIDPQFFGRLFVVFQRLHSQDKYGGTGIGLAVCKKIVERHGGRIWVESAPGQGSTFHFTLPAITPSPA